MFNKMSSKNTFWNKIKCYVTLHTVLVMFSPQCVKSKVFSHLGFITWRTRFVKRTAPSVNNKQITRRLFHHSRWLQPRKLKDSFAKFYQHVNFATRGNNTMDFVYTTEKNVYKAVPRPHLGHSDHISVMLIPAYRPLLKLTKPVQKLITNLARECYLNTTGLLSVHRLEHV